MLAEGSVLPVARDPAGSSPVVGRADDMVTVRGLNVFPTAVAAVLTALPEVWILAGDGGAPLSSRRVPDTSTAIAVTDGAERVFVGDRLELK